MKTQFLSTKSVVLAATLMTSALATYGQVIYDNTTTDLGQFHSSTSEYGDEISFAGTARLVTEFKFEYFFSAVNAGGETATFRVYNNDGPNGTPGALRFTSDPIPLSPNFHSMEISGLTLAVPDRITWTIEFSGLGAGEEAGLLVYGPPTIGSSFNDFWQRDSNGAWSLLTISGGTIPANFAAQVTAVPEPSTIALGLLAVGFFGVRAYRRR